MSEPKTKAEYLDQIMVPVTEMLNATYRGDIELTTAQGLSVAHLLTAFLGEDYIEFWLSTKETWKIEDDTDV